MKIIGIINSMGEYQGNKYHNLVLHCSYPDTNGNRDSVGFLTDTVKLRFTDINSILGMGFADQADVEKLHAEDFGHLLNKEIEVAYNKFGAVQAVKVLDSVDKSNGKENK